MARPLCPPERHEVVIAVGAGSQHPPWLSPSSPFCPVAGTLGSFSPAPDCAEAMPWGESAPGCGLWVS